MLRHLQGNEFNIGESAKSLLFAQDWEDKNLERINSSETVQNLAVRGSPDRRIWGSCTGTGGMWGCALCSSSMSIKSSSLKYRHRT